MQRYSLQTCRDPGELPVEPLYGRLSGEISARSLPGELQTSKNRAGSTPAAASVFALLL